MKVCLIIIIGLSVSLTTLALESRIQYFEGSIQVSSMDAKVPYGPSYDSLTKRIVDFDNGKITECVFQKGRLFLTEIKKTETPLVFSAQDLDSSFAGYLTFSDEALSSWSYNIDVLMPNKGKITGSLPENGAVIDQNLAKMTIKKIWNNQTLISESYSAITYDIYQGKIGTLALVSSTPEICK